MIKNVLLKQYQKKIHGLRPAVNIIFTREIPLPSAREITHIAKTVAAVNAFESELRTKENSFFKEKTHEIQKQIRDVAANASGEEFFAVANGILDEHLPFYFAMVREAARRTVKMRHFDVQVAGGIILHSNKIAEMTTGEGKTLVATLAASLNALAGRGVHIVTVNDYLARRDWEWMGPIYRFLGLSVGVIQQDMDTLQRKAAYACDITYGTNNEFGFDYLRDNMKTAIQDMVQRHYFYAIVDEVDSILVDEARTPLIISGPAEISTEKYYKADQVARQLAVKKVISTHDTKEGTVIIKNTDGSEERIERDELEEKFDAVMEEKSRNAYLTRRGEERCESLLGVTSVTDQTPDKFSNFWNHYIVNAIRAHRGAFTRDKDYIVKDGKVIIVDEFTGRLMPGRRWSEGVHQAIEAKERLSIQQETQTLATVTLQNYFRMYAKLSGMTGTAYTEANEFRHIYKLDVVAIPTNKPLIRASFADRIYKTKEAKFRAVVAEIQELYEMKRPVLVGTVSVDDSETLSFMLKKKGILHNVLNAKYHEREAHIVAQAGRLGQVTIATNMAGRGTDIVLGGNIDFFIKDKLLQKGIGADAEQFQTEYNQLFDIHAEKFTTEHDEVVSLGGLHIIGTQRHEARRIDNQLKGRSGRQGDPGSSRFYIGLDDDLMRLFGSDRIYLLMDRFGFPEDEPIEHPIITHSIEVAQKKVEAHNFEIRKNLLQFDDVMNRQREAIYSQRRHILEKESVHEEILDMFDDVVEKKVSLFMSEEPDYGGLHTWVKRKFGIDIAGVDIEAQDAHSISELLKMRIKEVYRQKAAALEADEFRIMEKIIALSVVDSRWKEHLLVLDYLREGISLRSYAHVDPLVEYQKETYLAFQQMIDSITEGIVELVFRARLRAAPKIQTVFSQTPKQFVHSEFSSLREEKEVKKSEAQLRKPVKKVGRNEPCPCGSGKKYKKCCGR